LEPAAGHAVLPDGKRVLASDWSGDVQYWPVAEGTPSKLPLPIETKTQVAAVIPVPSPPIPAAVQRPATPVKSPVASDLDRKRAALKALEDAAERLKEEAARNPRNAALTRAYLQVCEAVVVLKAEVLEAEAAVKSQP
jgi:hypothetical protein